MIEIGLFILLGSALTTLLILPKVINVARFRALMDKPNKRSSHEHQVPRLGGVAFFITLTLSFYFMQRSDQYGLIHSILPCLTILFIVGLKDDLVMLTAKSKLLMQFLVATFLIFDPDLSIRSLHGALNVYHVPMGVSIALMYLIIVGIINAINLIDGIDGLASFIGIPALTFLALCFFQAGKVFSFFFMLSMIGCLLGFIPFNLSKKNKIFMGDTGSLILGFVLSFGVIRMLTLNTGELYHIGLPLSNIPFLLLFILFVPVMDTVRVMTLRILRKRSPFKPDRTHLHHYFLDTFGWSHVRTSSMIGLIAVVTTAIGYQMCLYFNYVILLVFFCSFFLISVVLTQWARKRNIERKRLQFETKTKILRPTPAAKAG